MEEEGKEIVEASKTSASDASKLMELILAQRRQNVTQDQQQHYVAARASFDASLDVFRTIFVEKVRMMVCMMAPMPAGQLQPAQAQAQGQADQPQNIEESKKSAVATQQLVPAQHEVGNRKGAQAASDDGEDNGDCSGTGEPCLRDALQVVIDMQNKQYQRIRGRKVSTVPEESLQSYPSRESEAACLSYDSNRAVHNVPQQIDELFEEEEEEERKGELLLLQQQCEFERAAARHEAGALHIIPEMLRPQVDQDKNPSIGADSVSWESAHDDDHRIEQREKFDAAYCIGLIGSGSKAFRRN